jgi:type VI secretion system secreted protein Hcp
MNSPSRYLLLLAFFLALPANGAFNTYLTLRLGEIDIEGETSINIVGGDNVTNMIECFATEYEMFNADPAPNAFRPSFGTFKLVKRLDKATPLLAHAFAQQTVGEAVFQIYGVNPEDGATRREFTITLENARISSVRMWSPNSIDPHLSHIPRMEEIQIRFSSMEIHSNVGGTSAVIEVR